ncbi:MAG: hypothetical protein ACK4K0_10765 [Flavobacteriales bacterium]
MRRDDDDHPLTNPNGPNKYQVYTVYKFTGTIIPTIGIVVAF